MNDHATENLTTDSVYEFYVENLFPAISASLPLLLDRLKADFWYYLEVASRKILHFLLPWSSEEMSGSPLQNQKLVALWEKALGENSTLTEFMLRHLDTNNDGYISPSELLHMNEVMAAIQHTKDVPTSWLVWFNKSWPLMDWKLGVFLWRTCGGLLLLLGIATIVPGRLHGYSGRLLRWPILGLTYFMIGVELVVYIIIRLFIRLIESIFANSKHRAIRRDMRSAKSYEEWYEMALKLDKSQDREKWQQDTRDDSSYRYNWSFISELIKDMRLARNKNDSIMGLAVLQQCTRKNVGGVMSEEQFSYTNTGQPKHVVNEFIQEVAMTLKWVTEEASEIPVAEEKEGDDAILFSTLKEFQKYEERLKQSVKQEKNKMQSLVSLAALSIFDNDKENKMNIENRKGTSPTASASASTASSITSQQSYLRSLPPCHRQMTITFLKRARATYGRTALCLSGGAMMGNYHFGHVKALFEEGCLPHIISGTSAGSVVGAFMCCRSDDEITRDMKPEILHHKMTIFSRPWGERFKSLYRNGHLFNGDEWLDLVQWFTCGNMTFEEAYKKTGRVLCITLTATTKKAPPVLLNYITAPNVVVASAAIASAAVPWFIPPVRLQVKDHDGVVRNQTENKDELYWDGSIQQDIPTTGLAEMLNCHFFVAAQCNPHIVPFFFNSKGAVGRPSRWSSGTGLREDSWRGGFLLSALEMYLKSDMRAKFHFLNDIEAAVGFTSTMMTQTFEGTTTIVPRASLIDYFKLFSDPTLKDMQRYFQAGTIAAYQHCSMIQSHHKVANALDECLENLTWQEGKHLTRARSTNKFFTKGGKTLKEVDGIKGTHRTFFSPGAVNTDTHLSEAEETLSFDGDEFENAGFEGMTCTFTRKRSLS